MTQFDMRCVEKVGLIKFDFLGLKTLTTLADAERRVREAATSPTSIEDRIPLDDEARPTTCSGAATPRASSRWSPAA